MSTILSIIGIVCSLLPFFIHIKVRPLPISFRAFCTFFIIFFVVLLFSGTIGFPFDLRDNQSSDLPQSQNSDVDINGDNNNVTIYNGIDSNMAPSTIDDEFTATTGLDNVERENLLTFIQNLNIGNSKDWIDSKFGPATFTRTIDDEYCECVYVTDVAIVRIFYDISTSSCQAFFVTSYNLKPSEKIEYPKHYSSIVSGKALGEFTYYEIVNADAIL